MKPTKESDNSLDLKRKLRACNPEIQKYVNVLERENLKLQKHIAKLQAENLSLRNKNKVLEEQQSLSGIRDLSDEELRERTKELIEKLGYVKKR